MMDGDPPPSRWFSAAPSAKNRLFPRLAKLAQGQRALELASQPATARRHARPQSWNPARRLFTRICPSPQHAPEEGQEREC